MPVDPKKYSDAVKKLESISKKRELVEAKILDENKKLTKGGGREDIQKSVKMLEKLHGDHEKLCKEFDKARHEMAKALTALKNAR